MIAAPTERRRRIGSMEVLLASLIALALSAGAMSAFVAGNADVIVKAAAVSDFRPTRCASHKLKKSDGPPDVTLEPRPQSLRELVAKAERDCFIGASLTARPRYHWTVNGEELL